MAKADKRTGSGQWTVGSEAVPSDEELLTEEERKALNQVDAGDGETIAAIVEEAKGIAVATVSVPLAPEDPVGYRQRHIEAHLDQEQAGTMKRLRMGLEASGATLNGGRRVTSAGDVVRWLMEKIGGGQ